MKNLGWINFELWSMVMPSNKEIKKRFNANDYKTILTLRDKYSRVIIDWAGKTRRVLKKDLK